MAKKNTIEFEEGSGNVFTDLGLEGANELYLRAQIGFHVCKLIEGKRQSTVMNILGITQPEASHLMNGNFNRFSAEKLLEFLNKLNQKVTIQISEHKEGEPYQEVAFAHA